MYNEHIIPQERYIFPSSLIQNPSCKNTYLFSAPDLRRSSAVWRLQAFANFSFLLSTVSRWWWWWWWWWVWSVQVICKGSGWILDTIRFLTSSPLHFYNYINFAIGIVQSIYRLDHGMGDRGLVFRFLAGQLNFLLSKRSRPPMGGNRSTVEVVSDPRGTETDFWSRLVTIKRCWS
jgi:hypothetical protein